MRLVGRDGLRLGKMYPEPNVSGDEDTYHGLGFLAGCLWTRTSA